MLVDWSWGDLGDIYGSKLGSSQSNLIWSDLIGACGSELGRSMLDRVLPDQSCGSVLVIEMVWIRPRGRVDLCSKMGIEMGREIGIEREQQIRKKAKERERERARVCKGGS